MSTPGGTGFEYRDDSVIGRVSIDVPQEGLTTLAQIGAEADKLRTTLEMMARAEGDFVRYLQELPAIQAEVNKAQNEYEQSLTRTIERQRDLENSGVRGNTTVQYGADNFGGATSGMGRGRDSDASPSEARRQSQDNAASQRRGYVDLDDPRHPHNRGDSDSHWSDPPSSDRNNSAPPTPEPADPDGEPGDPTPRGRRVSWQNATRLGLDSANDLLGATRPGSPDHSGLGAASRIAGRLGSLAGGGRGGPPVPPVPGPGGGPPVPPGGGAGGGALGTIATRAGIAGAVLAGGLAINKGVQEGGEQWQQYKNAGMVQGGGAGEGMAYEMNARMMAMNPFLNTEQSRQIIQSALQNGYSGNEFDTVTGFMAENMKEMNMSVSDSMKLLKKNVQEGGQSIEGLGMQLGTLKSLAAGGARSFDDLKQEFGANTSALVDAGVDGGVAGEMTMNASQIFKDNQALKDISGSLLNGAIGSDVANMMIGSEMGVSGVMPSAMPDYLSQQGEGKYLEGIFKVALKFAKQAQNAPGVNKVDTFQALMARAGWNLNRNQAEQLMNQVLANPNLVADGAATVAADVAKVDKVEGPGIGSMILNGPDGGESSKQTGDWLRIAGSAINDTVGVLGSLVGLGEGSYDDTRDTYQEAQARRENRTADWKNNRVQDLVTQYGSGKIEVIREDGTVEDLDQKNEDQIKSLGEEKSKVRIKGQSGGGQTLSKTFMGLEGTDSKLDGSNNTVSGELKVTIDQNGRASAPGTVPLTQNQQQSNQGYSRTTPNNPPPGDK